MSVNHLVLLAELGHWQTSISAATAIGPLVSTLFPMASTCHCSQVARCKISRSAAAFLQQWAEYDMSHHHVARLDLELLTCVPSRFRVFPRGPPPELIPPRLLAGKSSSARAVVRKLPRGSRRVEGVASLPFDSPQCSKCLLVLFQ